MLASVNVLIVSVMLIQNHFNTELDRIQIFDLLQILKKVIKNANILYKTKC